MSGFYAIHLKQHDMDYKQLNELAERLVAYALKHHFGLHFNNRDYRDELIEAADMHDFILVSTSFLYNNFDLLDDTSFVTDRFLNREKSWQEFYDATYFLQEINKMIFQYPVTEIEVYLSDGGFFNLESFHQKSADCKEFLLCIFNSLYEYSEEYYYGFPSLKITIR